MKINEPKLLKLEVGKYYRTYGGWCCKVIWKQYKWVVNPVMYVIHQPGTAQESHVVNHTLDGKALSILSVNEPPQYTEHHPADLKEIWK